MDPLIELRNVTFGYDETRVLDAVNLHLHHGQFAAIVGPSGAGKTSLLKLVLGTQMPNHGTIYIDGKALRGSPPAVSYVPQVDAIDWNFPVTVEQVVLMGRARGGGIWPWPRAADKARAYEVMSRLEVDHLAKKHIRNLSGGQQQRVFLARALIAEPELLVLDEPTSGVDMQTAERMLHFLIELNQQGLTVLMTTHDLNMAAVHIPWIICLNRRVIAQGVPHEIFTDEILSATYQGDMMVIRHQGMLLVHQRPHSHTLEDVVPDPVPGHLPDMDGPANGTTGGDGHAVTAAVIEEGGRADERLARTVPV